MRPPMPAVLLSRRTKIALAVVVVIIVLLVILANLAGVYVNFKWYGSVGHSQVYSTMLETKVVLFFVFGVMMALILGGNLLLAYRLRPPFRPMSPEQQNLQHYVLLVEPRRRLILGVVMAIALISAGASAQGRWQEWQLWLNGRSFGQTDPLFGRDISFYAWDYPVYRTLLGFGFTAVIFSLILVVAVEYLTGAIRLQTPGPKITFSARRHLTVLVFVFMALKAVAYWLDRYGLVFSARGGFTGASYTDVHSLLPAKTILFWVSIILALGVLGSMWLRSALLPAIGFVVLLIMSILIGSIYPAIVQAVSVKPNASDKEAVYIQRNINATREAYDIVDKRDGGTVTYSSYKTVATPNPAALEQDNATMNNIRILDPNVISPTFSALQRIQFPYGFASKLNVDRYADIAGEPEHDYIVGARELLPNRVTGNLNNWINQYTVYTHGYGFVAAQADEDVTDGKTPFTEGDIPPSGPLGLTQPDLYYGQLLNNYAIVGAKGQAREYNGSPGDNVTYAGSGGVSLSSLATRLAFALKYKETNFLLNDAVSSPGAKILLNRDPRALLQKVAPFLTVDGSPYPVVQKSTGHIVWMLDGYTTMANFPYSARQSLSALTGTSQRTDQANRQINYIRNSVKATVDAYTGTVHLYAWDPSDPILQSWMKVYPGLVQKAGTMPKDLRSHIRYPQDLFNVQRALLASYHISGPRAFYNGRGKWGVPQDPFPTNGLGGNQPPYYVLANPPGSTSGKPQFQLTTPLVANNAPNLAAYMSADSDPDHYGDITVLEVPTSSTVQGPGQIANAFKSKAVISKDIQQLSTGQSSVIHGNLLTLPIGNSFLYVEPLYVTSDVPNSSSYPTLQRVLVAYGSDSQVGYGATLQNALNDIEQGLIPGSSINTNTTTGPGTPSTSSSSPPGNSTSSSGSASTSPTTGTPPSAGSLAALEQQLETATNELQAAYSSGNAVRIARAQQSFAALFQQYAQRKGISPGSGGATPSP